MDKEEIPAGLPKQFSESLKRIGEQAKEWQTKKLDTPDEDVVAAVVATKVKAAVAAAMPAPAPTPAPIVTTAKQPFNWSATSLVVTLFVLAALAAQTVWLRQSIEALSVANKDLQLQVEGLTQEVRTLQEAAKTQALAPAPTPDATAPAPTEVPNPAIQQIPQNR